MHSILRTIILKVVTIQHLNYRFNLKLQLSMGSPPVMWWHSNG